MDDHTRTRLENQAFMASVISAGDGGVRAPGWISFLVDEIGGFVGDVTRGRHGRSIRLAMAKNVDESAARAGSGLGRTVSDRLMGELSEMDAQEADFLHSLLSMVEMAWREGGVMEAGLVHPRVSCDFIRSRHSVASAGGTTLFNLRGRSLEVGEGQSVVAMSESGMCTLATGAVEPFETVSYLDDSVEGVPAAPPRPGVSRIARSPLADRIARSVAGSVKGPEPEGLLISRGEDGGVMVIASRSERMPDRLRLLPSAVQLMEGDDVLVQTEFARIDDVIGWLARPRAEVALFDGIEVILTLVPVEIRASA